MHVLLVSTASSFPHLPYAAFLCAEITTGTCVHYTWGHVVVCVCKSYVVGTLVLVCGLQEPNLRVVLSSPCRSSSYTAAVTLWPGLEAEGRGPGFHVSYRVANVVV
jgi:hypothetical protein